MCQRAMRKVIRAKSVPVLTITRRTSDITPNYAQEIIL